MGALIVCRGFDIVFGPSFVKTVFISFLSSFAIISGSKKEQLLFYSNCVIGIVWLLMFGVS